MLNENEHPNERDAHLKAQLKALHRQLQETGNVDPEMAKRLIHLFDALNKLGTTVIVATHDLHLLTSVPSAEMIRLDRGQLADPTGALRNPPRKVETAGGLG